MWQLLIILEVFNANFTYGGPIVVEGFKTEAACYAHAEKLKRTLPQYLKSNAVIPRAVPRFEHVACVQKETS